MQRRKTNYVSAEKTMLPGRNGKIFWGKGGALAASARNLLAKSLSKLGTLYGIAV